MEPITIMLQRFSLRLASVVFSFKFFGSFQVDTHHQFGLLGSWSSELPTSHRPPPRVLLLSERGDADVGKQTYVSKPATAITVGIRGYAVAILTACPLFPQELG